MQEGEVRWKVSMDGATYAYDNIFSLDFPINLTYTGL